MRALSRQLALSHGLLAGVSFVVFFSAAVLMGRSKGHGPDATLTVAASILAAPQLLALGATLGFRHWAGTLFALLWTVPLQIVPMDLLLIQPTMPRSMTLLVLASNTLVAFQLARGIQLALARRRLRRLQES